MSNFDAQIKKIQDEIKELQERHDGILGGAIVRDRPHEVLDLYYQIQDLHDELEWWQNAKADK